MNRRVKYFDFNSLQLISPFLDFKANTLFKFNDLLLVTNH